MRVLGLDIGGANLKAADNDGHAVSRPFALWKQPQHLARELTALLGDFAGGRRIDRFAVTMTAELCDCFETKAEGVDRILSAVEAVTGDTPIVVWQTGGEFVPPDLARELWPLVAAANWHALASFCGRMVPNGSALLIDIGSTTTDVIPLLNGSSVAVGMTDFERLAYNELVYTGVRRTPVAAVTHEVNVDEKQVGLSSELFATMQDVYLLLDAIAEAPDDRDTADGRPATKPHAGSRLARMLCCDRTELDDATIYEIARQLADRQCARIATAFEQVVDRQSGEVTTILLSGEGTFLAENVIDRGVSSDASRRISLPDALGAKLSTAACAFAVSKLAAEAC